MKRSQFLRYAILATLVGFGANIANSQLPSDETERLICAAENNGGAIFIISMIELQGPNEALLKLGERLQEVATEHLLAIEASQAERFAPDPVPADISLKTSEGLVDRTGFVIQDLSALLAARRSDALVRRLSQAPACGTDAWGK